MSSGHCPLYDIWCFFTTRELSLMNFQSVKTNNVKFHCGWGQRLRTRLWTLWLWFSKVLKLGAIDLMIYDSFCLQNFNFYKFYRIKYSILLFFVLLCLLFCRGRRERAAILSDPTDRTERPMSHSKYWDEVETPLLLFSYVGEAKRYIVAWMSQQFVLSNISLTNRGETGEKRWSDDLKTENWLANIAQLDLKVDGNKQRTKN